MSIATKRDFEAQDLLMHTPPSVQLTVPSICYIEVTTLEKEEQYSKTFLKDLDNRISEAGRDQTSAHAGLLRSLLEQSRISFSQRLNDIQTRFYDALNILCSKAEMITLNTNILQNGLDKTILEKELIDRLILNYISYHASLFSAEDKVFLSCNNKDFGKPEVREALRNAGIIQYFSNTQAFLGWLRAQLN
jgi:hypothetical protein